MLFPANIAVVQGVIVANIVTALFMPTRFQCFMPTRFFYAYTYASNVLCLHAFYAYTLPM